MMKLKTFLTEFTADENLAEADLDEIGCHSLEASKALRQIVERAFRLGVAEGLSSAECVVARALGITADQIELSDNPALRAVMQMSVRCYRAASEPARESKVRLRRRTRRHTPRFLSTPKGALGHNQ